MSEELPKSPPPSVPISWGELVDKITILEIKAERIEAAPARQNVETELGLIRAIADRALATDAWLRERKEALKHVNEKLWEIEDNIRAKEAARIFDETFIALARSVYIENDERARIKREISIHLSSGIVEEKSYKKY
jgi:hypothetical protein